MKKGSLIISSMLLVIALSTLAFKPAEKNNVVWTQVVQLDATQAGTMVETMGLAIFRLTSDMKLTYKLIVQKHDDSDAITAAHVHYGAAGMNGGVAIDLTAGVMKMGKNVTITLTAEQYDDLLNDHLYVNVHSDDYPGGVIRGQIR